MTAPQPLTDDDLAAIKALRGEMIGPKTTLRLVAEVERLRAKVERVEAAVVENVHADTCGTQLSPGAGYPCSCWKADLRTALGEP